MKEKHYDYLVVGAGLFGAVFAEQAAKAGKKVLVIERREHRMEPYYPINDKTNAELFGHYQKLAEREQKVIFGGRLGEYRYYDMDLVIESALKKAKSELK